MPSNETTRRRHPYAIGPNAEPGGSGAFDMRSGDRVVHRDGRHGVADEFLSDGDAFVSWDDGTFETVRWNSIRPERSSDVCQTCGGDGEVARPQVSQVWGIRITGICPTCRGGKSA